MTQEDIMNKYPILYQDKDKSAQETLMCFGFECGKGWYQLLDELSAKIEAYNVAHPESPVVAVQVKQKFGGLRFYTISSNPEVDAFIDEAEGKAWKTCEVCGSTEDVSSTSGWITMVCKKCLEAAEKRKK